MHNPHKYEHAESGRSIVIAAVATCFVTFAAMTISIWLGERSVFQALGDTYQQWSVK
jgi:hypothetical protein